MNKEWEYERTHCTRVSIKLNNNSDADIISYLDILDNKQGYIKSLIRKDINEKIKDMEEGGSIGI